MTTSTTDAMDSVLFRLHAVLKALTAPGATTKSDGGMEGHADPSSGRSSRASHLSRELEEAGIKPGPSDTRPADVTVTPRVIDNDRDEIVVTLNGNELRGWGYSTEQERRVKMLCAREFVEGFHAGRQP